MKTKILLTISLFFIAAYFSFGQAPKGFNYQAIARDGAGTVLADKPMTIKIGLLANSETGSLLWEEQHAVTSNKFGLVSIVVGNGTRTGGSKARFTDIDWNAQTVFIKTTLQPQGYSEIPMGATQVWSVPYSLVAEKANGVNAGAKLSVISSNDAGTDALFEVRRKDGQTVFAVYPDAVNVYVPKSGGKGSKGGFAVGGFNTGKAEEEYFRVSPDSVRIYIDPSPSVKGSKGGFAVGGYGLDKGMEDMYFNLTGASSVNTVVASPQVLWYPNKNAFLAGNVHIGHVDSVGNYSTALGYQSRAIGNYSQAFGYKATAAGDYSTSIGKRSIAGVYKSKHNAFALGNGTLALGEDSYAFGSAAQATGEKSFAFGSVGLDVSGNPTTTPTTASGSYSMALGMGARATSKGAMALGVGSYASGFSSGAFGYTARAEGYASMALGRNSYTTSNGYYSVAVGDSAYASGNYSGAFGKSAKAKGSYSVAVGYNALTSVAGSYSGSFGYNASAKGAYSVAVGYGATTSNSNALALGNGTIASGTNSTAMGYQSQAQGDKSIAIGSFYTYSYAIPIINLGKGEEDDSKGFDDLLPIRVTTPITTLTRNFSRANIASGQYSVAIGNGNNAQNGGLVFGSNSDAIKFGALALGQAASANETNSIAIGYNTTAKGIYSAAIGNNLYANSYGEIAMGQWNDTIYGTKGSWNENELLFTLGNGLNSSNKSNALTIYKNGKTIVRGRYAVSTFNYKKRYIWPLLKDYVYGIYTSLSRDDSSIEYYYSGYFTSTGDLGTYRGLYADYRTGASIDVAEYIYDTQNDTEPADVVVADPSNKESVIKSSKPYQNSVVGVISTKPHMTMGMELVVDEKTGEPLKDAKPTTRLALTGRVPVKVTNEGGPIQPGDMLTTSSVPGHAMKWTLLDVSKARDFEEMKAIIAENERRRNAILGKAIESFSGSGTGKIMVLISLQ